MLEAREIFQILLNILPYKSPEFIILENSNSLFTDQKICIILMVGNLIAWQLRSFFSLILCICKSLSKEIGPMNFIYFQRVMVPKSEYVSELPNLLKYRLLPPSQSF